MNWLYRILKGRSRKQPLVPMPVPAKPLAQAQTRIVAPETLEPRCLMAADAAPIEVGLVYIESDTGSDVQADRFLLTFQGGAPGTELKEVVLDFDKDQDGLTVGDLIFDTVAGGRGKGGAFPFTWKAVTNTGSPIAVTAVVEDGSTKIVLNLSGFHSGDQIEFNLDVDEVVRMSPDLATFNQKLDELASGQEMEDSLLSVKFTAPHFYDVASPSNNPFRFLNDYRDPTPLKLPPNVPPAGDVDNSQNRNAAAFGNLQQKPLPIEISGTVWVDNNLNLTREAGEATLPNVEVALFKQDSVSKQFVDTGLRAKTDSQGKYVFGKDLKLDPAVYRVVETQPAGYFSVGAKPGTIAGQAKGSAADPNTLTDIAFEVGDTSAINYDFAEAQPAEISGYVYRDDDNDGVRDQGEVGIGQVEVRLVPITTIAGQQTVTVLTDGNGFYKFTGLAPGAYRVVEVAQPVGYRDGKDTAGTVDAKPVGVALNDAIEGITLNGNSRGVEYNFGELLLGSLSGMVFLQAPGEDCDGTFSANDKPLEGVSITLLNAQGNVVAQTTTNASGQYKFDELLPGIYTIREVTPPGLLEGDAHVGTIKDITIGVSDGGSIITNIALPAGGNGVHYDFCEASPATISGNVYHDKSNDGVRNANEPGIGNVTVALQNKSGTTVATTTTNSAGAYTFTNVLPGDYQIVETQPTGYLDGLDTAGKISGATRGAAQNPGDRIVQITIKQGEAGIEYNFGELLPSLISGIVHVDLDKDCTWDTNEKLLSGVKIHLLDESGKELKSTVTNAEGYYEFLGLPPGKYTVVEEQPAGYFDGGAKVGTTGGDISVPNQIRSIELVSGAESRENNFCENPPSEINGIVFSDRDQDCVLDADEDRLDGVKVDLLDDKGNVIATTFTDLLGRYRFSDLKAGTYTVFEHQPAGYLQGGQTKGSKGGDDTVTDRISKIPVGWGEILVDYNFCEIEPASLSGHVYNDIDQDCVFDQNEPPIANVQIDLLDASGKVIATQFTDADGNYRFTDLKPGTYQVVEHQPAGYLQGGQVLGSAGGKIIKDDHLGEIPIRPGDKLVDYDFCEINPGSISGRVWQDVDAEVPLFGQRSTGDIDLSGVVIELLDSTGQTVRTTTTNAQGQYSFGQLKPGVYGVREQQPAGLLNGGENLGSDGGTKEANLFRNLDVASGEVLTSYDFFEYAPGVLSGYVFQDGGAVTSGTNIEPQNLRSVKDGLRTADDKMLAGVVIEMRDSAGNRLSTSRALPGTYSGDYITTVTDANGYYEFRGLPRGDFHIYQVQPTGYIDSLDTAGTTGGFAVNAADQPPSDQIRVLVQTLATQSSTDPRFDAIVQVSVRPGGNSRENNFSEIVIKPPVIPPQDPPKVIVEVPEPQLGNFPAPLIPLANPQLPRFIDPIYLSINRDVTWHLSVINAGYPRGEEQVLENRATIVKHASTMLEVQQWMQDPKDRGRWELVRQDGTKFEQSDELMLGDEDAIPLAGDFDGDGRSEIALFVNGSWFIDLNGNGRWDTEDLWISLGTELDRPVVGDWDGDGKDDIGIFGPEWYRDEEAIRREPGIPDPENPQRSKPKNPPPTVPEATDGGRLLRRTPQGSLRADLIDHVFRYGQAADRPVAGDWNGDGIDTVAIFRGGRWMLDMDGDGRWSTRDEAYDFGKAGDEPIVGDWDGDGIDDLGVRRGDEFILDSDGNRRMTDEDRRVHQPRSGRRDEMPVSGDWDGDGVDEVGTYHTTEEQPPGNQKAA